MKLIEWWLGFFFFGGPAGAAFEIGDLVGEAGAVLLLLAPLWLPVVLFLLLR